MRVWDLNELPWQLHEGYQLKAVSDRVNILMVTRSTEIPVGAAHHILLTLNGQGRLLLGRSAILVSSGVVVSLQADGPVRAEPAPGSPLLLLTQELGEAPHVNTWGIATGTPDHAGLDSLTSEPELSSADVSDSDGASVQPSAEAKTPVPSAAGRAAAPPSPPTPPVFPDLAPAEPHVPDETQAPSSGPRWSPRRPLGQPTTRQHASQAAQDVPEAPPAARPPVPRATAFPKTLPDPTRRVARRN